MGTKLHQPTLPAKFVQRPHLSQRLNEGLEFLRQITLVSAPAGFGKSTCISAWVDELVGWDVTWLSLEPADDDPARFMGYLIAALQKMGAGIGEEIEGLLRSGQLPSGEVISTVLINDLWMLDQRCLLILDDFHVIQDRFNLQVIEKLIANLPQMLHMVLITREDPPLPLARIRVNNRMTEIRATDLRFSRDDARQFMQEILGQPVSAADMAVLVDKTEGWIAGLQLAGLSIQGRQDPSSFIADLGGSRRFILSYLIEEVLSHQPDEMQQFLLQTALLDKLNSELCAAVTGRSDSHSLLERAYSANLFLIPLDHERGWYRYHQLFAELLRDLLYTHGEQNPFELHRRASHWYAQAHMQSEAIEHALKGEDFALAVDLLENHALEMIMKGYAKTVNAWQQAIPEKWESQSPRTNLAFAWMHLLRGSYPQAAPYLELVKGSFSTPQLGEKDRRSLEAEWLVMRSLLLNSQGDIVQSLSLAEQAWELVPEQDSRVRSLAYFGLACAYESSGNYHLVVDAYQKAVRYAREAGSLIVEMLSISGLSRLAFERGKLNLAFEIVNPVTNKLEGAGSPAPISTVIYGILGEVYYQWYQPEQARRYIYRALQLSMLGGYISGITSCRVFLSRLSLLEGDLETAATEIQKAQELMHIDTPGYVRQEAISQQVRVHLARDVPAAAKLVLEAEGFSFQGGYSYPELPKGEGLWHSIGLLYCSSLHLLLYMSQDSADAAALGVGIELADSLITAALKGEYLVITMEALLLRAQMYALLGDFETSQGDITHALDLGEPEGFISVFLEGGLPVAEALANPLEATGTGAVHADYIQHILEAFSSMHPQSSTGSKESVHGQQAYMPQLDLVEPLTEREFDVLRLMAEGLKYKEIAAELYISLNTVRYHVKTIYGKLGVNNRTQAIQTARQHRIL